MNNDELQWFTKEIEGNEKLRAEVNLRKRTDVILENHSIISLRNKLAELEKQRAANIPEKSSGKPTYIRYAAVFSILVIIGSITLFTGRNLTSDEIMNRYYKTYEPATGQRSLQSETNADFTLALEFYNTHDYAKAAVLFNKVVENNPKDMQSTLLSGISNFENNKYPEAKRSFGNVISDNDNLYIDQAEWYLALCYVKTNDREKAIQQFEMIRREGGFYRNDAKKILRKLK
jgi:tetratricopeptide (TPR) repeat protein